MAGFGVSMAQAITAQFSSDAFTMRTRLTCLARDW